MTYLEILSWARKGVDAEQEKCRSMQQELAARGQSGTPLWEGIQKRIDRMDVLRAHLDEIQELHDVKL